MPQKIQTPRAPKTPPTKKSNSKNAQKATNNEKPLFMSLKSIVSFSLLTGKSAPIKFFVFATAIFIPLYASFASLDFFKDKLDDYDPQFTFVFIYSFAYGATTITLVFLKEKGSMKKKIYFGFTNAIVLLPIFIGLVFLLPSALGFTASVIAMIMLGFGAGLAWPSILYIAGLISPKCLGFANGGVACAGLFNTAVRSFFLLVFGTSEDESDKGVVCFFAVCILFIGGALFLFIKFFNTRDVQRLIATKLRDEAQLQKVPQKKKTKKEKKTNTQKSKKINEEKEFEDLDSQNRIKPKKTHSKKIKKKRSKKNKKEYENITSQNGKKSESKSDIIVEKDKDNKKQTGKKKSQSKKLSKICGNKERPHNLNEKEKETKKQKHRHTHQKKTTKKRKPKPLEDSFSESDFEEIELDTASPLTNRKKKKEDIEIEPINTLPENPSNEPTLEMLPIFKIIWGRWLVATICFMLHFMLYPGYILKLDCSFLDGRWWIMFINFSHTILDTFGRTSSGFILCVTKRMVLVPFGVFLFACLILLLIPMDVIGNPFDEDWFKMVFYIFFSLFFAFVFAYCSVLMQREFESKLNKRRVTVFYTICQGVGATLGSLLGVLLLRDI